MALQGTIDAFPLGDVLGLLSSSSKTGRLVLEGDRGTATLWIEDGRVVGGGGSARHADTAELFVFEMLRFGDGSFAFDSGGSEVPEVSVQPTPLAQAVEVARGLLDEWDAVAAIVPSTRHRVRLVAELASPSVTIGSDQWPLVVAAGTRPTVAEVIEQVRLGELDGCSAIAALVGAGVLEVQEPSVEAAPPSANGTAPHRAAEPAARAAPSEPAAFPDHFPIDDLVGAEDGTPTDPWTEVPDVDDWDVVIDDTLEGADGGAQPHALPDERPIEPVGHLGHLEGTEPAPAEEPDTADATDEVLRQMSRLSPQAAEAIAAALNPTPAVDDRGTDGPSSFLEAQ